MCLAQELEYDEEEEFSKYLQFISEEYVCMDTVYDDDDECHYLKYRSTESLKTFNPESDKWTLRELYDSNNACKFCNNKMDEVFEDVPHALVVSRLKRIAETYIKCQTSNPNWDTADIERSLANNQSNMARSSAEKRRAGWLSDRAAKRIKMEHQGSDTIEVEDDQLVYEHMPSMVTNWIYHDAYVPAFPMALSPTIVNKTLLMPSMVSNWILTVPFVKQQTTLWGRFTQRMPDGSTMTTQTVPRLLTASEEEQHMIQACKLGAESDARMLSQANTGKMAAYFAWRRSEVIAELAQKESLREQEFAITIITTGQHKGRSFAYVFDNDVGYTNFLLKKYLRRDLSNPVLKDYVWYANRRRASQVTDAAAEAACLFVFMKCCSLLFAGHAHSECDHDLCHGCHGRCRRGCLFGCVYVVSQFALCRPCPRWIRPLALPWMSCTVLSRDQLFVCNVRP